MKAVVEIPYINGDDVYAVFTNLNDAYTGPGVEYFTDISLKGIGCIQYATFKFIPSLTFILIALLLYRPLRSCFCDDPTGIGEAHRKYKKAMRQRALERKRFRGLQDSAVVFQDPATEREARSLARQSLPDDTDDLFDQLQTSSIYDQHSPAALSMDVAKYPSASAPPLHSISADNQEEKMITIGTASSDTIHDDSSVLNSPTVPMYNSLGEEDSSEDTTLSDVDEMEYVEPATCCFECVYKPFDYGVPPTPTKNMILRCCICYKGRLPHLTGVWSFLINTLLGIPTHRPTVDYEHWWRQNSPYYSVWNPPLDEELVKFHHRFLHLLATIMFRILVITTWSVYVMGFDVLVDSSTPSFLKSLTGPIIGQRLATRVISILRPAMVFVLKYSTSWKKSKNFWIRILAWVSYAIALTGVLALFGLISWGTYELLNAYRCKSLFLLVVLPFALSEILYSYLPFLIIPVNWLYSLLNSFGSMPPPIITESPENEGENLPQMSGDAEDSGTGQLPTEHKFQHNYVFSSGSLQDGYTKSLLDHPVTENQISDDVPERVISSPEDTLRHSHHSPYHVDIVTEGLAISSPPTNDYSQPSDPTSPTRPNNPYGL